MAIATRWLAWMIAAAALVPGCHKTYPACKKDGDCKAALSERCVDGSCQGCKTDADCLGKDTVGGAPLVCREFRCQAPATAAASGPSSRSDEHGPCTRRTDCIGGLACKAGTCELCSADADCETGPCNLDTGRCSPVNSCTTDEQCSMDEICDGGMCIFSGDLGDEDGGPCGLAAVYFAFDSDVLTPKTQADLKTAAACIAQQGRLVYLEAHADNRGTEEYNILLTERRGDEVKAFLVHEGIGTEMMQVIAKGSLEAVASDEGARSRERRVQFIWP